MKAWKTAYPWFIVVLLLFVWMLNYLDRQVIFSIFPLLQAELHISTVQLGLLGTSFLWVYAISSPLAGHFADRFGSKRMICFSLLVWSLITLLTGHVRGYGQLVAMRSLMGISEACYLPAGLAMIAAYHGTRTRSRAVSLHYSGTYLGTVLGGTLGGWIGSRHGWRSVFNIFGGVGVLYAFVLMSLLRNPSAETQAEEPPARGKGFKESASVILRTPGYRSLLTVFGIASICDWAIYTWFPLYLFERFHFSLTSAGFTATFWIRAGGFIGLLCGGLLADRWASRMRRGRVWTQTVGLGLGAPCLIVSSVTGNVTLLCASMLLFGLGKGMYDGNTMPVLCEGIPPEMRATAFGFLNFAGTMLGGAVALIAGALKATIGLNGTFLGCGLLLLVAAGITSQIRMRSLNTVSV
ncbi:MAG: MFS transporter [Acidobacteria bacterium]|nr:MFS transporter [Acidobacteriota bacterium]